MAKEWSLKRPQSLPLRLTAKEKKLLIARARSSNLSMVEFVRRKIFDIPLDPLASSQPQPEAVATGAAKAT